jgi:hypothetical protein
MMKDVSAMAKGNGGDWIIVGLYFLVTSVLTLLSLGVITTVLSKRFGMTGR